MALEGLGSAVRVVTTDLTRVADIETVQLVQPIRYRLAIPAQRQVLRIVRYVVFVIAVVIAHSLVIALLSLCQNTTSET